ncbi:DUF1772 domain-containing protein [Xanthobacter sp. KR7-225]|uniref:DUF1772 domain-containing protein n=1 Tax=Xanthobacter sp. KR7-225 TaxID=3156613 RepID=UPI0032B3E9B1
MMLGQLALVAAALFTGAALYINVVEQPARLALTEASALAQFRPADRRGFAMQAVIVVFAFVCGAAAFLTEGDWHFLAGGVLMLGNWPYTFIGLAPTEQRLMAVQADDPDCRRLLSNWGQLHMVRTGLGLLSTFIFFQAVLD